MSFRIEDVYLAHFYLGIGFEQNEEIYISVLKYFSLTLNLYSS